MKKIIITLIIALLFGAAAYEVKTFNNSASSSQTPFKLNNQGSNSNTSSISSSPNQNISSQEINIEAFNLRAADFKLKDLNGKEVPLDDLKGKRVFLNFWATWCPPCRGEMPEIEKLYEENKNSDLVILAINLGEDMTTVKSFMNKNNYKFKALLDSDQKVAIQYNITSIPTSFFIDKNGAIIAKKIGTMSYDQMSEYIEKLNK